MKFWDSSALIPLIIQESSSPDCLSLLSSDPQVAFWWCSPVEIASSLERRLREGALTAVEVAGAKKNVEALANKSTEVGASEQVRMAAIHLLRLHPLRAADALQLGAALFLAKQGAMPFDFVTLDERLRSAALAEGAGVYP